MAALLFVASGCCLAASSEAPADGFCIEHVNVLPMTADGAVITDATIVVRGRLIKALGRAGKVRAPQGMSKGMRCVDGTGKWLIPGLADMHVHVVNRGFARTRSPQVEWPPDFLRTEDIMLPFIANGVTQILDMSSLPESLQQREQVRSGAVLGPHYAAAGEIDGPEPVWGPMARAAKTPEEGRRAVREIKAERFDFVKVYSRLDVATYQAILDEAKAQRIRVVGHLPDAARGHAETAITDGLAMVAHAEEYAKQSRELSDRDIQRFVALAREHGIWLTPTLMTMDWIARQTRDPAIVAASPNLRFMHPALVAQWLHANRYAQGATPERARLFEQIVDFNGRLVRAFSAAGIPMMPGTDAIIPGIAYGFSLHDELQMLVKAGMTNSQVLQSATRLPAEFLGVADRRGTIGVGKTADLVLLDADPLVDIANTRRIAAVAIGGRYLSRADLDARMNDLASRFARIAIPQQTGGTGDDR